MNALDSALRSLETIREVVARLDDDDTAEAARDEIMEYPLEVSVRSGWTSLGQLLEADEYRLLLSTGGPASCITGNLDGGEAYSANLMYQDWFTPWTPAPLSEADSHVLLTFAQQFYYGD